MRAFRERSCPKKGLRRNSSVQWGFSVQFWFPEERPLSRSSSRSPSCPPDGRQLLGASPTSLTSFAPCPPPLGFPESPPASPLDQSGPADCHQLQHSSFVVPVPEGRIPGAVQQTPLFKRQDPNVTTRASCSASPSMSGVETKSLINLVPRLSFEKHLHKLSGALRTPVSSAASADTFLVPADPGAWRVGLRHPGTHHSTSFKLGSEALYPGKANAASSIPGPSDE